MFFHTLSFFFPRSIKRVRTNLNIQTSYCHYFDQRFLTLSHIFLTSPMFSRNHYASTFSTSI